MRSTGPPARAIAPRRPASAVRVAVRATCAAFLCDLLLIQGVAADEAGADQSEDQAEHHGTQPSPPPGFMVGAVTLLAQFPTCFIGRLLQEGPLGGRQVVGVQVESGLQAGAAVELGRVAAGRGPAQRCSRQLLACPSAGPRFLEPVVEAGPAGEHGLVRDLDIVRAGHHKPAGGEGDQRALRGRIASGHHLRSRGSTAHPLAVTHGCEAQQDATASGSLLVVVQGRPCLLPDASQGAGDSATRPDRPRVTTRRSCGVPRSAPGPLTAPGGRRVDHLPRPRPDPPTPGRHGGRCGRLVRSRSDEGPALPVG